jgi:DNA-damage-inducible protein D
MGVRVAAKLAFSRWGGKAERKEKVGTVPTPTAKSGRPARQAGIMNVNKNQNQILHRGKSMNDDLFDLSVPMGENDVFHFDDGKPNFNDLANENGFTYWWASDLMKMLGYQSIDSFMKPINKAIATCSTLAIDLFDNFSQQNRIVGGKPAKDYRLSRFACYLVAMNADSKKVEVARAQAFFAALAEAFQRYVEQAEDVERVLVREEISIHERTLSSTAKQVGVTEYGLFQNAGYRGLYNMNINRLKSLKSIPGSRSPLDFMGGVEMAANLFRITQTELKLKTAGILGQKPAEQAAFGVGREVRNTMQKISGVKPEDLPAAEDIKRIRGDLKASHKDFKKLDKPKKRP